MNAPQKALVIVHSNISNDPRVRREIDWLATEGWTVDSLGLGVKPSEAVRDHFPLSRPYALAGFRPTLALIQLLFPFRLRFKLISEARIPTLLSKRVAAGEYDLIVFNDTHFIPWIGNASTFTTATRHAHIHLDLHEYFPAELAADTPWKRLFDPYWKWGRSFITNPSFTSRSAVAGGIADLYMNELGVPPLYVIRNAPPYVEQEPGPVDPNNIRLLHHGVAAWERGLGEMIDAIRLLDGRFTLTLMMTGSQQIIDEARERAKGLERRVLIVPPVSMAALPKEVNKYDLEVMFYRPATRNLLLALPNKLFEAVQGRLGVVIGESPSMVNAVEGYGNGFIVKGWTAEDLAAALSSLTAEQVIAMKRASTIGARDFSAEHERDEFFRAIRAD